MMRKCIIDSIRASLTNQQRLVVLKDAERDVFLPIWIGMFEAEAIAIALQKIEFARPQTHVLFASLLKTLDINLIQIDITSLKENVFFANLVLERAGERILLDCRPSDAIVLAAQAGVPIFVDEAIFDDVGIIPGHEAPVDEDIVLDEPDLDVFRDFLDNLGGDVSEPPDTGNDDEPLS